MFEQKSENQRICEECFGVAHESNDMSRPLRTHEVVERIIDSLHEGTHKKVMKEVERSRSSAIRRTVSISSSANSSLPMTKMAEDAPGYKCGFVLD